MNRTDIAQKVGKRIREAREGARYSRDRLSEVSDASPSAIGRWEKGENLVPIDQLLVLSATLDKPVSFFLQDLSNELAVASEITGRWLPVVEEDRSEQAVRLRDIVEGAYDCEVYVALRPQRGENPALS